MTSQGKHNALLVTCVGALFVSAALLGLMVWLQVVALQFEIRTLRGRVERLERSHELRVHLKALSEAALNEKYSKYNNGSQNEVELLSKREDLETKFEDNDTRAPFIHIQSYKINDNSRAQNNRLKREVVYAYKKDSLPVHQESQNSIQIGAQSLPVMLSNNASSIPSNSLLDTPGDKKPLPSLRKNKEMGYRKKHIHRNEKYNASTPNYSTSGEAAVINRPYRVMKTDVGLLGSVIIPPTFRKKPVYEESRASPTLVRTFTRPRRRRPKHEVVNGSLETMDEGTVQPTRNRQIVAAHYHGDTSGYTNSHEHYDGNGRLRHPDGNFRDWTPVAWMHTQGMNNHFSLYQNGFVNIRSGGLYFIYVQIYYVDTHDTNGFRLYVNRNPILHCTTHSSNADHSVKANTCFTGSVAYLHRNDNVSVSDVEGLRYSLFEPAKSFFGFFKIGENNLR